MMSIPETDTDRKCPGCGKALEHSHDVTGCDGCGYAVNGVGGQAIDRTLEATVEAGHKIQIERLRAGYQAQVDDCAALVRQLEEVVEFQRETSMLWRVERNTIRDELARTRQQVRDAESDYQIACEENQALTRAVNRLDVLAQRYERDAHDIADALLHSRIESQAMRSLVRDLSSCDAERTGDGGWTILVTPALMTRLVTIADRVEEKTAAT